jgi:uncharacterized NAD(P)/FAD-binding protein YdhS
VAAKRRRDPDLVKILERIETAARSEKRIAARLRENVKAARRQGATWQQIADASETPLSTIHGKFRGVDAELKAEAKNGRRRK